MLIEQRTLTVTVDEKNQEVALRWDSQFQVGPNAGKVTLHGPKYDGLGLRLPESFDHVAKFQNSADLPYPGPNTQNVIPARWTSVAGLMDGREVMLALFGRADNARGDARFFTMLDPFAYLSATQGLDKQPLEYAAGDKFSLSYLLTVYSEHKPPEFITRRARTMGKGTQMISQPHNQSVGTRSTASQTSAPKPLQHPIQPIPYHTVYEQNPHWH